MTLRRSAHRSSLYFAAPLFTPEERALNESLTEKLERKYSVFLPQRDGQLIPGKRLTKVGYRRIARDVFAADITALKGSSVLFAVLNGRVMDEGTCFEIGFAYGLGIRCVGYWTDSRVLLPTGMNPMIEGSLDVVLTSDAQLNRWLNKQ